MSVAAGLLAFLAMGADGSQSADTRPIVFQVQLIQMRGLDWRTAVHARLTPVANEGTTTVWTADRELANELVKRGGSIFTSPTLVTQSGQPANIRKEDVRGIVYDVKRIADGPVNHASAVAFQPKVGNVSDWCQFTLRARAVEAGCLTRVSIEENRLAGVHTFNVNESVPDAKGGKPASINAQAQVPEVARTKVQGEWLIPSKEVLVVSLGVHTAPDSDGKAAVHERVAVIQAEPAPTDLALKRASIPASGLALPPVPLNAPVPPAPVGLSMLPDHAPGAVLPMAVPPSRLLPTPIAPDGTIVPELPPLPEDLEPAVPDASAEPRPAPQIRHKDLPSALGDRSPVEVADAGKAGTPARATSDGQTCESACVAKPKRTSTAMLAESLSDDIRMTILKFAKSGQATNGPLTIFDAALCAEGECRLSVVVSARAHHCLGDRSDFCPADLPVAAAGCPDTNSKAGECQAEGCALAARRLCQDQCGEMWEMTLGEALRIALENHDPVHVTADTARLELHPSRAELAGPRFKAHCASFLRSVEQEYWALSQAQARFRARESALAMAEDVLKREEARLKAGHGSEPRVTEAKEQLERFKLDMIDATAEMITNERQLRRALDLPATGARRIVPVTPPRQERASADWPTCLAALTGSNAELASAREQLHAAALRYFLACNPSFSSVNLQDLGAATEPTPEVEAALEAVKAADAMSKQTLQQATHDLARTFLQVESATKLCDAAASLKQAATRRLEVHRTCYEDGQLGVDRYLDAIRAWSDAIVREAGYAASYSTAVAALEEAKGTLLDYHKITVTETPGAPAPLGPSKNDVDAQAEKVGYQPPREPPKANVPAPAPNWSRSHTIELPFGGKLTLRISTTTRGVDTPPVPEAARR